MPLCLWWTLAPLLWLRKSRDESAGDCAPAPPSRGHARGRSGSDRGSISGRLSKATDRFRSASRGRKDAARSVKSPSFDLGQDASSNYVVQLRSPVAGVPPPIMYDTDVMRSPIESKGQQMATGLHQSEMI